MQSTSQSVWGVICRYLFEAGRPGFYDGIGALDGIGEVIVKADFGNGFANTAPQVSQFLTSLKQRWLIILEKRADFRAERLHLFNISFCIRAGKI
jgi:hypothetical protein